MNPEDRARRLFEEAFGRAPEAVRSAPGRVNLIGEHVDYHGGRVLPMATPMRTAVALGPGQGTLGAVSESASTIELSWPPAPGQAWSDYVAGVAVLAPPELQPMGGLSVAVASDLPMGAGLSSSAALEVATALSLAAWRGHALPARAIADLAWRAETEFVGMPCGRMDQLAAAMAPEGSALLIDCLSLEVAPVPVGVDVVLVSSGEEHALRQSGYSQRRQEGDQAMALLRQAHPALEMMVDLPVARLAEAARQLPPPLDRRVRHVVNENQRTTLAARALETGDFVTFGTLVNQSHDSLRDLYGCSTAALDDIVTRARGLSGVLGARLVGAGWGGSVLVVVEPGQAARVAKRLEGRLVLAH